MGKKIFKFDGFGVNGVIQFILEVLKEKQCEPRDCHINYSYDERKIFLIF